MKYIFGSRPGPKNRSATANEMKFELKDVLEIFMTHGRHYTFGVGKGLC